MSLQFLYLLQVFKRRFTQSEIINSKNIVIIVKLLCSKLLKCDPLIEEVISTILLFR